MTDKPISAAQRLLPKLARIMELKNVIALSADRILPKELRQEIDNEYFRLEFALNTLADEVRARQADTNIKHLERIVELLKQKPLDVLQKKEVPQEGGSRESA